MEARRRGRGKEQEAQGPDLWEGPVCGGRDGIRTHEGHVSLKISRIIFSLCLHELMTPFLTQYKGFTV